MRRKYRLYQQLTFPICMNYLKNPTPENRNKLKRNLHMWAASQHVRAYDYVNCSFEYTLEYCSDRMNAGRAKALLKMMGT